MTVTKWKKCVGKDGKIDLTKAAKKFELARKEKPVLPTKAPAVLKLTKTDMTNPPNKGNMLAMASQGAKASESRGGVGSNAEADAAKEFQYELKSLVNLLAGAGYTLNKKQGVKSYTIDGFTASDTAKIVKLVEAEGYKVESIDVNGNEVEWIYVDRDGLPLGVARLTHRGTLFQASALDAQLVQTQAAANARAERLGKSESSIGDIEGANGEHSQIHDNLDNSGVYISRPVLNADEIHAWAKKQGFRNLIDPRELHVTVAYSREPFAVQTPGMRSVSCAEDSEREVKVLGDSVVLTLKNDDLQDRWHRLRGMGASWDYDDYTPHVSVAKLEDQEIDFSKIVPFSGAVSLGCESVEPIDLDYSPNKV